MVKAKSATSKNRTKPAKASRKSKSSFSTRATKGPKDISHPVVPKHVLELVLEGLSHGGNQTRFIDRLRGYLEQKNAKNLKPPRPMNSFIVYRSVFFGAFPDLNLLNQFESPESATEGQEALSKKLETKKSVIAGEIWRSLSESDEYKDTFLPLAGLWSEAAESLHHEIFPDYKYQPKRSSKPTQKFKKKATINGNEDDDDETLCERSPESESVNTSCDFDTKSSSHGRSTLFDSTLSTATTGFPLPYDLTPPCYSPSLKDPSGDNGDVTSHLNSPTSDLLPLHKLWLGSELALSSSVNLSSGSSVATLPHSHLENRTLSYSPQDGTYYNPSPLLTSLSFDSTLPPVSNAANYQFPPSNPSAPESPMLSASSNPIAMPFVNYGAYASNWSSPPHSPNLSAIYNRMATFSLDDPTSTTRPITSGTMDSFLPSHYGEFLSSFAEDTPSEFLPGHTQPLEQPHDHPSNNSEPSALDIYFTTGYPKFSSQVPPDAIDLLAGLST